MSHLPLQKYIWINLIVFCSYSDFVFSFELTLIFVKIILKKTCKKLYFLISKIKTNPKKKLFQFKISHIKFNTYKRNAFKYFYTSKSYDKIKFLAFFVAGN